MPDCQVPQTIHYPMTSLSAVDAHDKRIANWLFVCCGLVFAMVVLGGFTRLTGSGLSMAEWRPIMGTLPPLTPEEWQRVFDIYRQTPEYQQVNAGMDIEGFKGIFWLEYLHRLLGRLIGIAYFVPLVVFAVRGWIAPRQLPWFVFLLALGGVQAVIGKIMVASGQVDAPAVSQYKLAAHLGAAFLVYALMLWTALNRLRPPLPADSLAVAAPHPWFGRAAAVLGLVSVTVVSGAFVAGLKAGKIYNTFPLMGDSWIAPGAMAMEPAWRNFFDNPVMAQFDHRVLALTTLAAVLALWFGLRSKLDSARLRVGNHALLAVVILQVSLGILTLLSHVSIPLAAAHQATGLVLVTAALYLTHGLKHPE